MPPLEACEWAPPVTPGTSGVGKNEKKEGTATKHHTLLLSLPWEHIHPVAAMPNALGSAQILGHYPFPRSYN